MWRLPENSIVIQSINGLGDRLQALEGAILLGKEINKRVYVSWPLIKASLYCDFHDMFEKSEEFKVLSIPVQLHRRLTDGKIGNIVSAIYNGSIVRYFYNFDAQLAPWDERLRPSDPPIYSWKGDRNELSELASRKRILVSTYYRFFPGHADLSEPYNYVRSTAALRMRVEETTRQFNGRVVGIHIRRGDVTPQRKSYRYVPLDSYIKVMREEIARDPSVKFFLATQHQSDREHLRSLFGDRLIIQPGVKGGRNNVEGVKSAVVDMFALAKTDLIVSSGWSGFPQLAARIEGGVEMHVLGLTDQRS